MNSSSLSSTRDHRGAGYQHWCVCVYMLLSSAIAINIILNVTFIHQYRKWTNDLIKRYYLPAFRHTCLRILSELLLSLNFAINIRWKFKIVHVSIRIHFKFKLGEWELYFLLLWRLIFCSCVTSVYKMR